MRWLLILCGLAAGFALSQGWLQHSERRLFRENNVCWASLKPYYAQASEENAQTLSFDALCAYLQSLPHETLKVVERTSTPQGDRLVFQTHTAHFRHFFKHIMKHCPGLVCLLQSAETHMLEPKRLTTFTVLSYENQIH